MASNLDRARQRQDVLVDAHRRIKFALDEIGAIPLSTMRQEGLSCRALFQALADLETAEKLLASTLQ